MKIDVSPTSKKFEPITLTITFETRDELLDMWTRHALKNDSLTPHIKNYDGAISKSIGHTALIDAVNNSPRSFNQSPLLSKLKEVILR